MKKIILVMAMFIACITFAKADNDTPITVQQLPVAAQEFINQHFGDKKVALAKKETDFLSSTYDVIFTDGNKLEFDRKGQWTEVNCKYSSVPEVIVPQPIKNYINDNFKGVSIIRIERDTRDYEVKLANRTELKFDLQFRLLDIDMD